MKHIAAFSWYGGKLNHLKWLLPFLEGIPHITYAEPFGGSAAVLLNKKPAPVEVYNDVNKDVSNFFEQLRDHPNDIVPWLIQVHYSHYEYNKALKYLQRRGPKNRIWWARRFFVVARQIRTGLGTAATPRRWAYIVRASRHGISQVASRWYSSVAHLFEIADRMHGVQIEDDDCFGFIDRYDSPDTLFYCDPPYLHDTRTGGNGYAHEFSEEQHKRLLKKLLQVEGKVVLSGYDSELYNNALAGWEKHKAEFKCASATAQPGAPAGFRQEVLWIKRNATPKPKKKKYKSRNKGEQPAPAEGAGLANGKAG